MWYRQHLRQVRRARRQAKAQQRALLTLELEGFVALTLHPVTGTLTVPVEREVGAQVADTLREALCERRRTLQVEAGQRRRDGDENDYRRRRTLPESTRAPPPRRQRQTLLTWLYHRRRKADQLGQRQLQGLGQ